VTFEEIARDVSEICFVISSFFKVQKKKERS